MTRTSSEFEQDVLIKINDKKKKEKNVPNVK